MTAPALSPAMAARLDGQARAVRRAAATHAATERLSPLFDRPSAIRYGTGPELSIAYGDPYALARLPVPSLSNLIGERA